MLSRIKDLVIGPALATSSAGAKQLNKIRALADFSPDALSSIAYANQEIYLGLIVAGSAGLVFMWPIGLVITGLLVIVALSYYQTIHGYPSGGGSYIVARANLGTLPGLIAAAALLVDYILNASVSLTAGVGAIASAFPSIWPYRVILSLILLAIITLINLRGLRETGTIMAIPVYLFLATYIPMLLYGAVRLWIQGPTPIATTAPAAVSPLTLFLVLHAFATGCTALTGIEAISNGVPAFKEPKAKNAGQTLIIMAILMGILFVGSIGLTQFMGIIAGPQDTILSALARRLFGNGFFYLLIQFSTLLILTVAANTSFADFPRVTSIVAGDGFLPRQLRGVGERLVFTNGIILLSIAAGALIVIFNGDTHALIPLFAIGAFLAFTLSQAGMVLHWYREKSHAWRVKAFLNGLGALATGATVLIVAFSKFLEGAWITILVIPLTVVVFYRIRKHYEEIKEQLSLHGIRPTEATSTPARVVIPISGVHRGMINAVAFAQTISAHVTAVYIELEPDSTQALKEQWLKWWPEIPLVIIPSPYRTIVAPLLDYLEKTDRENNDGKLAVVVLPEFITTRWWQNILHNQMAWLIKTALLYSRRSPGFERVVIDVPYRLGDN